MTISEIERLQALVDDNKCSCESGTVFIYESNEYVVVNGEVKVSPTDSSRIILGTCSECDKILFTDEM